MSRSMIALCVLLLSFCAGVAAASPVEYARAVTVGMKPTVDEAEALEERLAADADDLTVRSQLVVYHHRNALRNPGNRSAHGRHVLWLIRNAPQAAILGTPHGQIDSHRDANGYIAAKDAWASHLEREPTNGTFLGHAASFCSPFQDRDMAVETLERAQLLDPGNAKWPMQLGHLYLREANSAEMVGSRLRLPPGFDADDPWLPARMAKLLERRSQDPVSLAGEALEHLRRAYELADPDSQRAYLLDGLAEAAFRAGHSADARI